MIEYLSLHTKVRRLGYIKLLVRQYFNRDFISASTINQYFEKVASEPFIQKQLEDYSFYYRKDKNGIIENKGTGTSASFYTRLAEDLSIIAKSNYSFVLTKYGKVYKVIYERYESEKEKFKFINEYHVIRPLYLFGEESNFNPFVLNTLDKLFFLKQILEKDFLYVKTILKVINDNDKILSREKVKYALLKESLNNEIVNQLKVFQQSNSINPKERQKAIALENKFSKKELKIRSYESIVEPRVNWLLDLDLLDGVKFSQDILKLTLCGKNLTNYLCDEFDPIDLTENRLIKLFCQVYDIQTKIDKQPEKKIHKYLDYAFINFKTLAPNRITASQAFAYISVMCFLREGIILEYNEIKKYLFSIDGKGYTIDWYPSENDGSIKKTK